MNRADAERAIRQIADAGTVSFTKHGRERAPEVGKQPMILPEILGVLRHGRLSENPVPGIRGGWKFTMWRKYDNERYTVAGALEPEKRIIIITAYKED